MKVGRLRYFTSEGRSSLKTVMPTFTAIAPLMWSDGDFDYFYVGSQLWKARRNPARVAAEIERGRSRRRVMLWNWAARCVVVAFVTADVVVLVVLIVLDLMIGGA